MARNKAALVEEASRFAPLTDDSIKAQTDSGSFSRGRAYVREGRLRETVLRDSSIESLCDGSDILPYRVQATLAKLGELGENPRFFSCTCPRGGFCKHIVALLLTWIDDPKRFAPRPSLADLLGEKSRDDLAALVVRMVQRYPDLERLVELPMPVAPGDGSAGFANVATVDAAVIRRQARSAFAQVDSYNDEWDGAVPGATDLYSLLELGQSYVAAGQWANAQAVFTNLAEETGETILSFANEEGEFSNIVTECDAGLTACLDAQAGLPEGDRLSEEVRECLIQAIYDIWRFDVFEAGGLDLAQEGPAAIARNVTDAERVMVEGWLREEKPDEWSKRLVTGFMVMLREHAGLDDEELLGIYREADLWDDGAAMLLRLDRVDEAVAIAGRHLKEPHSLISFANALIERGGDYIGRALSLVDDRAWEMEGTNPIHDAVLQEWLIAQFSGHDRPREALAVAVQRFKGQPMLRTYQAVQHAAELPGQQPNAWADLRPKLQSHLRAQNAWSVLVDLHLEESDVAAALDAFSKLGKQRRPDVWYAASWGYGDQELRLAQAAEPNFPGQAVAIYRQQAEARIGLRQRSHYQVAAGYLARAKETLEQHSRADEWQALISELRTRHKTLRALREELDALGLR